MKRTTEHTEATRIRAAGGTLSGAPSSSLRLHRLSHPFPCAPCLPWFLLLFLSVVASAAEFRVGWRRAGGFTELISTGAMRGLELL